MNNEVNLAHLTEPREETYFIAALVFSILGWLLCLVTISPMCFILFLVLFAWLANGLLVAQLKADAVKVDANQLPSLAQTLARVCAKLQVATPPALYVLQSGGHLNAFATRHCGRDFIVVYSEMLEAYGPDSAEIEFVLGHEIGHIRRRHLLKQILLAPGLLVPLLGNAYSRACELSCDRHGFFAASSSAGAVNAMLILAGGKQAKAHMAAAPFAAQYAQERGFFVSWYELISGYPSLSHRVANLIALGEGRVPQRSGRNPFAYLFAFFSVGGRGTGAGNILFTIALVGLLAAIAVPSFVNARKRSQQSACAVNLRMIEDAKERARLEHNLVEEAQVTDGQVAEFLRGGLDSLHCPKDGAYFVGAVGEEPECTEHGSLSEAQSSRSRRSP